MVALVVDEDTHRRRCAGASARACAPRTGDMMTFASGRAVRSAPSGSWGRRARVGAGMTPGRGSPAVPAIIRKAAPRHKCAVRGWERCPWGGAEAPPDSNGAGGWGRVSPARLRFRGGSLGCGGLGDVCGGVDSVRGAVLGAVHAVDPVASTVAVSV